MSKWTKTTPTLWTNASGDTVTAHGDGPHRRYKVALVNDTTGYGNVTPMRTLEGAKRYADHCRGRLDTWAESDRLKAEGR